MRFPSGDQAKPQWVSSAGSGGGVSRKVSVSGSMKCADIPLSQQKKEIVLPSGAQRALLAPRSYSGVTSLPSVFIV